MNLKVVFTGILTLAFMGAFGQKRLLYQASGITIQKGSKAFQKQEFEDALGYFKRVHPGDTNYVNAQIQLATTYIELQQYTQAIATVNALTLSTQNTTYQTYLILGKAYQKDGNTQRAIETYNQGIAQFPMNHLLHFHYGLLQQELQNDQEAINQFIAALRINPFHDLSHLKLAQYAEQKGEIAKAMMAYNLYLILTSNGDTETLIKYNEYLESPTQGISVNWHLSTDEYTTIDEQLSSLGTQNKKYKTPNKLTLPVVKQNHLLLTELSNQSLKDGFWDQFYVPFYLQVMKDQKFNDLMYYMLRTAQGKSITPVLKKNASAISLFSDYAGPLWQTVHSSQKEMFNGKLQQVNYYWGNTLSVTGRGLVIDNEPTGRFEYFHETGSRSAIGHYSEDGELDGSWVYYYDNGKISEKKTFEDGDLLGTDSLYYENGILESTRENQKGGNLFVRSYFVTGNLQSEVNYRDDELNGPAVFYYSTGQKDYETTFANDQAHGLYLSYYDNGQTRDSIHFDNGLKTGKTKEYYKNGQKKGIYHYSQGALNGTITEWYPNGKIWVEGTFENDEPVGTRQEFYPNGVLKIESTYEDKKSKITYYTEYDQDGKLNLKLTYKKGELISYEVFNAEGTPLEAKQKLDDEFEFNSFYTHGEPQTKGVYSIAGGKKGTWTEYDNNGVISSTTPYENGQVNGTQTHYYSSGKKQSVSPYSNELINGLFVEYYPNGQIYEQGYYINGVAEGKWETYYEDGQVSAESFYVRGKLNGEQKYFALNGKLDYTQTFIHDLFTSYTMYDTNETAIHSAIISKDSLSYTYLYPTGKVRRVFHYTGNAYHGLSTSYYPSGQVLAKGKYQNDQQDGHWVWYFENGKIEQEGDFFDGDKIGEWKFFYRNGQLRMEQNFENGLLTGKYNRYYSNGQLETELSYYNGHKHGQCKYYNTKGELQQVRTYNYGRWINYSYLGTNGKLVEFIPVQKESTACISYYANQQKSKEFGMVNGNFEGVYTDYYRNGQIQSAVNFKDNLTQGDLISYYENGTLESVIPYTNNAKHGLVKYYDTNGDLARQETYHYGLLHGKTTIYTHGKLTKTLLYYNNDLISE